ncbi:MAG TPA: tRNA (adenosine(37)-N6)-threonylcarbamoyltransferase complex ATPase subunit type 1 TsaE [Balneolaceae bacterium]|nr:tRNA (adenosine(37)-N6)-threonylcarbamoyltransferase complex ATPase subunit type 1 TsaE [Balneolaceae bacterium]
MNNTFCQFISNSEQDTIAFGRKLAKKLSVGDVVGLQGELGTGKTHLVKGIAEAFGIEQATVHSPTFSLIHEYKGRLPVYHFDCYRLESSREALEIGAEEYFYGEGVCVIEWPERIKSILPPGTIWIELISTGSQTRQFNIKKSSS